MADVTVRELAETVGAPVDRLLKQMQDAGLPHKADKDAVSDEERQELLAYLKRSHGEAEGAPRKITLTRKSVSTLKAGQGKGRTVAVEVRKSRTYVKRADAPADHAKGPVAEAPQQARPVRSQSEVEAERIRREDTARKAAEEETRRLEAEKKAEDERRRAEIERKKEEAQAAKAAPKVEETDKARLEREAAEAVAQAQATEQKAGSPKRAAKDRGRDKNSRGTVTAVDDEFGDGKQRRRREITLKPDLRRPKRKVDKQGGEFERPTEFVKREVQVPEAITVGDLAQRMSVKAGEVIKTLMGMGVMATINHVLDQDSAILVIEEMGHVAKTVASDAIEHAHEQSLNIEGDAQTRPPVVTIMGHVDHGKTSLLDYIRKTRVASGEAGGITQHIGAYHVEIPQGQITFLDTPGHAAFTAMRARGAQATDIVVLVVAADDGVMPQTEEAIQHARAAETPIIVAVNKMDKEGADPERVKNELASKGVTPDDWGGDTQFVYVSALTGQGIEDLLSAIILQAEVMELTGVPDGPGRGVVIESRLDRGRGPVATVLVQNGTLRQGAVLIAGEYIGRVRAMVNDRGEQVKEAGPSTPVEVLGLAGTPDAGDPFSVAPDERKARELADFRQNKSTEQRQAAHQATKIENMFASMQEGEKSVLRLVLKTDVRGSLEAITHAINDISTSEVKALIIGSGVGGISESDAMLALTSRATIFGFNVRPDPAAKKIIERENVDVRYYSVIYELLDDIKQVLSGMLAPEIREEILGLAEVRDVFRSPRYGQVAGCMVIDGTIFRNKKVRVLRDNVVIHEGELDSLRRFKDDVNEVRAGLECGIGVRNYDVKVGDKIEVFDTKEIARAL